MWNENYKNVSGKVKVPMPKDLYSTKLTVWQFRTFIAAFIVFSLGLITQQIMVIKAGLLLWVLLAIIYNLNVFILLLHKAKNLT